MCEEQNESCFVHSSVSTEPSLLWLAETSWNKGNFEPTVMGFVWKCCLSLMYLLFIHFQFALPSITSNKCPPQAPVSTSKSCRETWDPIGGSGSSRSADLRTALSGRSMVDVGHGQRFPSCRVCSVWSESSDSSSRPPRVLVQGSINEYQQTTCTNPFPFFGQSWYYRPTTVLYRNCFYPPIESVYHQYVYTQTEMFFFFKCF